jgi:DNA-binding GntR family transcriptional regulator
MVARLAASSITDRQLAILQRSIDDQRAALSRGDSDGYYACTIEFHEEIVRAANNVTLERLLKSVFAQMRAMRIQWNSIPTHLPQSCTDHEKILSAFRKRDPDLAEREARSYIKDLAMAIRREPLPAQTSVAARSRFPRSCAEISA